MSGELKVGDVVEVIGGCCSIMREFYIGREATVLGFRQVLRSSGCVCDYVHPTGSQMVNIDFAEAPAPHRGAHCFPPEWLRKKPPKADDQGESRVDFTPAEPEFASDLRRRLRSRETV